MKKTILWIISLFIVFFISLLYRAYTDAKEFENSIKEVEFWEDSEANSYMNDFLVENKIKDDFEYKKIKFIKKFPYQTDIYELLYNIEGDFSYNDFVGISFGMFNDEVIDIYIDNSYWEKANSITRKKLIYHELGHDVLNLEHSTNPNDYMYDIID